MSDAGVWARYGGPVRIAFGTDEASSTTQSLVAYLRRTGHEVAELASGAAWPEVGRAVGSAVASGQAGLGVVCCTTGTGVAIAANKVPRVRAALCADAETARGARRWNDANVVALSLRLTTPALGEEILDAFVSTPFDVDEASVVARVEPPAWPA